MIRSAKTITAVGVLLIAATFLIDSDWEVSHQVTIAADASIVWSVLIDLESYPEWNRHSPNVKGRVAVGEVVWVEAHLDEEVQLVQNIVLSIVPERRTVLAVGGLVWLLGTPLVPELKISRSASPSTMPFDGMAVPVSGCNTCA